MRDPLQSFERDRSSYERVEQPWVCGRAASGRPCFAGPDRRGRCRGGEEGGADGGPRCRPVRSLRARRGLLSKMVVAGTLGSLLILVSTDARDAFLSPGPLAAVHADLACAACHAGSSDAGGRSHLAEGDPGCMSCHEFERGADSARPHFLAEARLVELTRTARAKDVEVGDLPLAMRAAQWFGAELDEARCTACHPEHGGVDAHIAEMTDQRCQVCHVQRFQSFAGGHPEFGLYPHARRNPIAFDHSRHFAEHFAASEGAVPDSCEDCHTPDAAGAGMRPSFERHCVACHARDVDLPADKALVFFALPRIDPDHFQVDAWPASAGRKTFEVPAGMRLLLGEGNAALDAMSEAVRKKGKFRFDKRLAKSDGETGQRLAEVIAGTLVDLGEGGPGDVGERIQATLGAQLSAEDLDALGAAAIARELARARERWSAGESTEAEEPSGFFSSDEDFIVGYAPSGHADTVLAAWIPLLANEYEREGSFKDAFTGGWFQSCTKCHNVDLAGDGSLDVNWSGHAPDRLVKFRHAPHLGRPAPEGSKWPAGTCARCHTPAPTPAPEESACNSFFNFTKGEAKDPSRPLPEYLPVSKDLCVECHTVDDAGDACLVCHVYHAGDRQLIDPETKH